MVDRLFQLIAKVSWYKIYEVGWDQLPRAVERRTPMCGIKLELFIIERVFLIKSKSTSDNNGNSCRNHLFLF